jgi:hypothetical protein
MDDPHRAEEEVKNDIAKIHDKIDILERKISAVRSSQKSTDFHSEKLRLQRAASLEKEAAGHALHAG